MFCGFEYEPTSTEGSSTRIYTQTPPPPGSMQKKVAPERRPYCDPRLQDDKVRRRRTLHLARVSQAQKKGEKRQLNDCPFFNLTYGFDQLPLDPVKEFLQEKICEFSLAELLKYI